MTKHELIDAYAAGAIDRRDFVRRLTALGISAGAALAYAQTLAPQSASAAGAPTRGGFIVRAQGEEGDYGSPVGADEVAEALRLLIDITNYLIALIQAGLATFTEEDLDLAFGSLTEALNTSLEQLITQLAALESITQIFGKRAPLLQADPGATIADFLTELQDVLDLEASVLAGVIPVVTDGESRVTLTALGLVEARRAGYIRTANGQPAFPAAFEEAISVPEGRARLTELQNT